MNFLNLYKNYLFVVAGTIIAILVNGCGCKRQVPPEAEKVEHAEPIFQRKVKDAEKLIEELYTDITGFNIAETERKLVTDKGGSPVYGEIKFASLKTILDDLNIKQNQKPVLYDLGSGVGKVVVQSYLEYPFIKTVGVELSPTRHKNATLIRQELEKRKLIDGNRKLEFIHGDIAEIDICDATVIYMCSTCYPTELMKKIAQKCSKLKPGLHIITLKSIPDYEDYGLTLVKEYSLPMTWSEGSPVYVYKLEKEMPSDMSVEKQKENLRNQIKTLKTEIAKLENQVEKLEKKLEKLENSEK